MIRDKFDKIENEIIKNFINLSDNKKKSSFKNMKIYLKIMIKNLLKYNIYFLLILLIQ